MSWKRCTTLFVSLFLLVPFEQWLHACGADLDPYDYYPSFFQPSVTRSPAYTPFFYTGWPKYYDEWYDFAPQDTLPDANIAEWKAYTGGVPEADLDSFVYRFAWKDLSALYQHLDAGKPLELPPAVAANGMTRWFVQTGDREALGYLMYAKQCEPLVAPSDSWEAPQRDSASMMRLVRNGLQLQAAAQKNFFRWRYTYQVLRLSLYAGNPKQTLDLYESLVGPKTDPGIMYPRCLGLKAGALFRQNRPEQAAYLYSRVFDLSDEMKRSAYISYDWAVGQESAGVLRRCAGGHERAVVQVMDGLHEYGYALPKMQAAYEEDPSVKGLDVLMVREINKVESRYQSDLLLRDRSLSSSSWWYDRYTSDYYDDSARNGAAGGYGRYVEVLKTFAHKLAAEGKAPRRPFWLLASAYLSFVQGAAGDCRADLQKAAAAGPNEREAALHDLIAVLVEVRSSARMTDEVENRILPTLEALDRRARSSAEAAKVYRDLTGTVLATAYLRGGDTVRAICVLAQAGERNGGEFVADNGFLDLPGSLLERVDLRKIGELRSFYAKAGKTPYERWLAHGTPYSAGMLTELEGTRCLRQYDWRGAASAFGKVPGELLEAYTVPDAFRAEVADLVEPGRGDSAHLYNRHTFAKAMGALELAIAKDGRAEDLYRYGLGLYGMSYYGKAHHLSSYYRSSSDGLAYYESAERGKLPAEGQEYYSLRKAEAVFNRAAAAATDRELRARALWMAAKCWQKRAKEAYGNPSGEEKDWENNDYYRYALTSPYFRDLRSNCAGTAFYGEVLSGCGYFRDYVQRR